MTDGPGKSENHKPDYVKRSPTRGRSLLNCTLGKNRHRLDREGTHFAMRNLQVDKNENKNLRVIHGGIDQPSIAHKSVSDIEAADPMPFGLPTSLLVGAITSLVGAGCGVLSLLLYFRFQQPESYISQPWLVFVLVGAIVGCFMRLERPFLSERSPVGR